MNVTLVKFIAGVAVCVSCASATAAFDPQCYTNVGVDEEGEWHGDAKSIHIDIQRPSQGVVGQAATYDASASKTPSGNINFTWSERSGGLTYSSYNQPVIQVTPSGGSNGLNAYTRLVVSDPVCGFSAQTEFNVNYSAQ